MKTFTELKSMLKLRHLVFAAVAVVVCLAVAFFSSNYYEAYKFGYRGQDLSDDGEVFFAVGSATNYLPRRVMVNYQKDYELTEAEKMLVDVLGILEPNTSAESLPEGYKLRDTEPMFFTYIKGGRSLGVDGTAGVVARYDEGGKKYHFCESFFSVYCKTREEVFEKFQSLTLAFEAQCKPLKMYKYEGAWAAEYRRYCVICAIGPREDGTWSVMISVRDKSAGASNVWIPVEEQLEILENQKRFNGAFK